MENALKNLFAVSDLRNRVLFTLALLGVYRIGNFIPTPGVNMEALRLFGSGRRLDVRAVRHVHRRRSGAGHDLRARRDAVHQLVDHHPAAHRRLAVLERSQRRVSWAAGRSPSTRATSRSCWRSCSRSATRSGWSGPRKHRRPAARLRSRLELPADVRAYPDHGDDVGICGSASRSPSEASATGCRC